MNIPQLDEIELAISKLMLECQIVAEERIPIQQAMGRVLSQNLLADRDSPATDVSAMDGYAFRLADLLALNELPSKLPVCGVACAGKPTIELKDAMAVQIFTGACVPAGADCVVPRENTLETPGWCELRAPISTLRVGMNIRRRGENTTAGQIVLPAGTEINTATIGTLASFGAPTVSVRRALRVTILNSGDELIEPGGDVADWQIRDSNGPTLRSWLGNLRWTSLVHQARIRDDLEGTKQAIQNAMRLSDAVIVTGGVSAGDTDYIPKAIEQLGGKVVFHRLPIRPGRPVLGAYLENKPILGLPGNPISTAVTARVIAQPVLEYLVGLQPQLTMQLPLANPDESTLSLVWYRLIRIDGGACRLVESLGSGDFVAMGNSHGFARIPPGQKGRGPWKVWLW
jgi:molybdopterin molybdotransferase